MNVLPEPLSRRIEAMRIGYVFSEAGLDVDRYEEITGDANTAAGLRAYLDQAIERLRRECEPAGVLAQMALVAEEDD